MDATEVSTGKSSPLFAKDGWKYDKRVTAMMVEDMLFDPILGAKVLLSIKLPPHEELRLLQMWTTNFTLDDSGFSTGKSFTYAVVAALRSLLMAGRIGGILSGTFRQGKLIFQNFDRWHATNKIFRHCVKVVGGKPRLVHGSEAWEAHFLGGSTVRVLPPNIFQDSERLRSERWNDGYFDEWTTFGNFKALTSTMIGRVTAVNDFPQCPVRQNHIHLSSTPNFIHHPSYKIVKRIDDNIASGSQDYARFTCNYRHVPRTQEWERLVNRKVIFAMQTMNPRGVVESEVDGIWTADSMSYYSSSILDNPKLRFKGVRVLLQRLTNDDVYLAAFDMARGKDSKRQAGGDDFALSIIRIPRGGKAQYCCCVRRNNITAEQASGIIHDYHQRFHFALIMYDPQGGGMFVRDELRKPEQVIRGTKRGVYPIVEMGDMSGTIGDIILVPFRRSTLQIQMLWGKMSSDSVLVNRMHQNIRQSLENTNLAFPEPWDGWSNLGLTTSKWETDQMRRLLDDAAGLNELQRAHAEIDLSLKQLVSVDVERNDAGEPTLDHFGMYKFLSKFKKDSAYSLIYATVLKMIWDQMGDQGAFSQTGQEDSSHYASSSIV